MKMNTISNISSRINAAINVTNSTAAIKDWRVRSKRDKAMLETARELREGKGYIIATAEEINEKYGENYASDGGKKHVWAFVSTVGKYKRISVAAI